MTTLEVIAMSVDDALAAEAGGADRLELVADLGAGGVTPSAETIRAIRRATRLPIYVMIRPRGGGFVYTPAEVQQMVAEARMARELGADGLVLGALTPAAAVDEESLGRILEAGGLPATFHRAFEQLPDAVAALDVLRRLPGVERVLTSGGTGRPEQALEALRALVERSGALEVMVGGGVGLHNAADIVRSTGARAIHTGTAVRDPQTVQGPVSAVRVRAMRELVTSARPPA